MTNSSEMLAFIRAQGRINSTDEETVLLNAINESYQRMVRLASYPNLRATAQATTVTGTQNYDLPANFDRLYDDSVRYGVGSTIWGDGVIVPIVSGPQAEIWEALNEQIYPGSARIVNGSTTGLKALRLLPAFSDTPVVVDIAYFKKLDTITNSSTLEVPELAEAVCWDVLTTESVYSRDPMNRAFFFDRAKRARWAAESTLQQ